MLKNLIAFGLGTIAVKFAFLFLLSECECACELSALQIGAQVTETKPQKIADANDIADSMKQQLLLLVEWAKSIPLFGELSTDDKIALLKTHAGENLILGTARRSLRCADTLILGNGAIISRDKSDYEIGKGP